MGIRHSNTMKYYAAMKKEVLMYATTHRDLESYTLSERKQAQRQHSTQSIYVKCPGWENP